MKQNGPNPIRFYILYFFIQWFGSHIGINKTFESACVNKFARWLLLLRRPVTWMVYRHVVAWKEHIWSRVYALCCFDLGYRMALTVSNLHKSPRFLSKYFKIYPPSTVICYTHSQLAIQPCNVRRVFPVFIYSCMKCTTFEIDN